MSKFFNVLRFIVVLAAIGYLGWKEWQARPPEAPATAPPVENATRGIVAANGTLEAAMFDVFARSTGRLGEILVAEGDSVKAGTVIARIETDQLTSAKNEAGTQLKLAELSVGTADSIVAQRQAEQEAAAALLSQSTIERQSAEKRLSRSQQQWAKGAVSDQLLDDDKARVQGTIAAIAAGKARIAAADAAVSSASAQATEARASVEAARSKLQRIETEIVDADLNPPRDGRVQNLSAQPGQMLVAGASVARLVDLEKVSMTFLLPTAEMGQVAVGNEVRIKLDAAPQSVIPATVSFVSDVAELAPGTGASNDQSRTLAVRVRAQIAPELLQKHLTQINTALSGRAYIKTADDAEWPADLSEKLAR